MPTNNLELLKQKRDALIASADKISRKISAINDDDLDNRLYKSIGKWIKANGRYYQILECLADGTYKVLEVHWRSDRLNSIQIDTYHKEAFVNFTDIDGTPSKVKELIDTYSFEING